MSAISRRLTKLFGLLIGILFCFVGCAKTFTYLQKLGEPNSQAPVKSLVLILEPIYRKDLYSRLQDFANEHSLEFVISDYASDGSHVQVWMAGDDIKITATVHQQAPTKFFVYFYPRNFGDPPPKNIDELVNDFIEVVSKIPAIEIIVP